MSSKPVHSLAGLTVGVALAYFGNLDVGPAAMILVGTHLGASAPDWLEIPVWVTRRHWFRPNEERRHSLIPHRTITHTLSLWVVAFLYCTYQLHAFPNDYLVLLIFGFCAAGLSHLLLDIRTPMGIPLWPFGARYRYSGFRLNLAARPFH